MEKNYQVYILDGDGTKNNPFLIENAGQLRFLAVDVDYGNTQEGKYFKVIDNIEVNSNIEWMPIGNSEKYFEGSFDGNGKTISGIYIENSLSYQGLFGYIGEKGKVSNLSLEGTINSSVCVGGFASVNYGIIENCTNNASLTSGGDCCGGIVGKNWGIIIKCINNATILAKGQDAGGIAGENGCYSNSGFIIECINNGSVTANNWSAGGITAVNGNFGSSAKGFICNSYNTGTIKGGIDRRGGIVGQVKCYGGISYVYNCYNKGDIGGCPEIIGYDWGGADDSIEENNYGMSDATIDKLNVASNIVQLLKDTNLYRNGVWTTKDGNIVLNWE